jgi:hypothetical protein
VAWFLINEAQGQLYFYLYHQTIVSDAGIQGAYCYYTTSSSSSSSLLIIIVVKALSKGGNVTEFWETVIRIISRLHCSHIPFGARGSVVG